MRPPAVMPAADWPQRTLCCVLLHSQRPTALLPSFAPALLHCNNVRCYHRSTSAQVELGADVAARRPDTGETAMHLAAARGNGEAVGALVLAGADPGARDAAKRTPLHRAAEAVATRRGAAPREEGQPPLPGAAGMAVAGLVEAGADLDAGEFALAARPEVACPAHF